ncbi:MAG: hypothetical protein H5T86_16160 [Armatimonadetes bacterium]|nr:hypothetical protein [Armatimonadota bacterium]
MGDDPSYVPKAVAIEARIDGEWRKVAGVEEIDSVTLRVPFSPITTHRLRVVFPQGCLRDWIIRVREIVVEESTSNAAEQ